MARAPKLNEQQRSEIYELRHKLGVPYKDLAQQYGVSFQTIQRICEPDVYEKHKQALKKYQQENAQAISEKRTHTIRHFHLLLQKESDAEMIKFLEDQENINKYLRDLIQKDMNSRGQIGPEKDQ